MLDDLTLRQNIIQELESVPGIDPAHVGVSVAAGVVTLSGHVQSALAKHSVEKAVRRVRGVKAVAQELDVRLPQEKKVADYEIASRALRILAWDLHLPKDAVQVTVEHGILTLSGEVTWNFQRREAEADVRRLGGVRNVINNIALRPVVSVENVKARLVAAFERAADLDSSEIHVETRGTGTVILRGHVRTLNQQVAAENAAWGVPGVTSVENHIEVIPFGTSSRAHKAALSE